MNANIDHLFSEKDEIKKKIRAEEKIIEEETKIIEEKEKIIKDGKKRIEDLRKEEDKIDQRIKSIFSFINSSQSK